MSQSPRPFVPGLDAQIAAFVHEGQGVVRHRSRTRRLTLGGTTIHLKISPEPLDAEARMLERCAPISDSRVGTPRLVHYSAEHNVLVTEDVGGVILFNAVWNSTSIWRPGRWRAGDWVPAMNAIEGWLRRLHSLEVDSTGVDGAITPDRSVTYLCRNLEFKLRAMARDGTRILSEAQEDQLREYMRHLAAAPAWTALPLASIHGDLTLANLRVRPNGQVIVTDFADSRFGFALEDTVRLWVSLWELTRTGRHRQALLEPCLAELATETGTEPFTMLRIWNSVVRLTEAMLPGRSNAGRDRRRVARLARIHRDWLLQLLRTV